jgi:hypothetical protein
LLAIEGVQLGNLVVSETHELVDRIWREILAGWMAQCIVGMTL